MVTATQPHSGMGGSKSAWTRAGGVVTIELVVAILILMGVTIPVAFSVIGDQKLARNYYTKAVAMEIVDGELEVLAAGPWQSFPVGTNQYEIHAGAAKNLPPGRFTLMVDERRVRLEWNPATNGHGGRVFREFQIKKVK